MLKCLRSIFSHTNEYAHAYTLSLIMRYDTFNSSKLSDACMRQWFRHGLRNTEKTLTHCWSIKHIEAEKKLPPFRSNIFKCISWNAWISLKIFLKFVCKFRIKPSLAIKKLVHFYVQLLAHLFVWSQLSIYRAFPRNWNDSPREQISNELMNVSPHFWMGAIVWLGLVEWLV